MGIGNRPLGKGFDATAAVRTAAATAGVTVVLREASGLFEMGVRTTPEFFMGTARQLPG